MPKNKTILIIDDDETILNMLSIFLDDLGYNAVTKDNGVSARQWLSSNTPDLILMDVMLPEITGIELCKWIHSLENLKRTPIIHMTALMSDEMTRENSMLAGATDFITKPIEFDVLKQKISRILDK